MPKACIVVYGNIASGKSTFCQNLLTRPEFSQFKHLCLDDVKIEEFVKNPKLNLFDFNRQCKAIFMDKVKATECIIYESLGIGQLHEEVITYLIAQEYKIFYAYKVCHYEICLENYYARSSRESALKRMLLLQSKEYEVTASYLLNLERKLFAKAAPANHVSVDNRFHQMSTHVLPYPLTAFLESL